MNEQQAELYARIRAFDIDGGGAALPFSARLARENGWSTAHAARVIEEYRRFCLLAVVAGHRVSPSEAVDQAWHLHLTYTRSYWGVFCVDVLRTPLHHEPSQGGAVEQTKFVDQYRATVESYRRLFDHAPPRDLWPDPEDRWRGGARLQWVDLARSWMIPKPRRSDLSRVGAALAKLAQIGAAALRPRTRGVAGPAAPPDLDKCTIAYLNGGATLAADTAIVSLLDAGALELDADVRTLCLREAPQLEEPPRGLTAYRDARIGWSDTLHRLERIAYRVVAATAPTPVLLEELREAVAGQTKPIQEQLVEAGLIRPGRVVGLMKLGYVLAILGFFTLGCFSGKIQLFMVPGLCCVATACLLWGHFVDWIQRTRLGNTVLTKLREEHRGVGERCAGQESAGIAFGMALFGTSVLRDGPFAAFEQAIKPLTSCSGGGCGG